VQKRRHSLLEACLGTAIGFGIAYTANALVMPWMGFRITPHENLVYTTIFTVISVGSSRVRESGRRAWG
jgi:hypothetical protein